MSVLYIVTATVKITRNNSIHVVDFGMDREITAGIHRTRKTLTLTRYFTEEEIQRKKEYLAYQGKQVTFVPSYMTQQLSKKAVSKLIAKQEAIKEKLEVKQCIQYKFYIHIVYTFIIIFIYIFLLIC